MKTKLITESPFGELICGYFHRTFSHVITTAKEKLEVLTSIIIGTKETRYGAAPSPESAVAIRSILKTAIEASEPIPVLVPWDGIKGDRTGIVDIAEVSGVNQLIRLDTAIKEYYAPGLEIRIGIEDTGARWLYRKNANDVKNTFLYSDTFEKLVKVLRGGSNITPVLESTLMNQAQYDNFSQEYALIIHDYLLASASGYLNREGVEKEKLKSIGFLGDIPLEQREYYTKRYMAGDATISILDATRMLAEYLGGAKARYDLNGKADKFSTGRKEYIKVSYVAPVPGAPSVLFNTTLYNRTINYSDARTHIPAWRGKGYLQITGSNDVKAKITSFHDEKVSQLEPHIVVLSDTLHSVDVKADILLVD